MTLNPIVKVNAVDRALEVYFQDGNSIKFEDCWLRDHCRCSTCYFADNYQRAIHLLDIPNVTIKSVRHDKSYLFVTFSDDHESTYSNEFLLNFDYKKWKEIRRPKPILWHGDMTKILPQIHVDDFIQSVDGAKKVFKSLLDYGVALIVGVGATMNDTEVVCKALGGVQHTLYGGMWELSSKPEHADSSYQNVALAVHNDNTYFTEAAGLQVLHCVVHNGTGGETILVDGFYGAQQLKKEASKDFEFLTKFNVEAEFIEDGHHHTYSAPVIRVDKETGDFVQIRLGRIAYGVQIKFKIGSVVKESIVDKHRDRRFIYIKMYTGEQHRHRLFNVYDRTPMAFESSEDCRSYYRSLRNLGKYYQDTNNQWIFKLTPGTVVVMDNFRVLHGRTAYTGKRVLTGSYVSRSDWLDRARVLKLIG